MPTPLTGILRENVAALIVRDDGKILLGECSDKPGCWSFPQGGVDDGETRREALVRELYEEVGLRARDVEILRSRSPYAYLYPPGRLKKGIYSGQIQTYFLCRLRRNQPDPKRGNPRRPEFLRLRWLAPATFDLGLIPVVKREVTRQVLHDFFQVKLEIPPIQEDAPPDPADTDPEIML
jgi:putative (di)nucleoside polyphosphate hydrolase